MAMEQETEDKKDREILRLRQQLKELQEQHTTLEEAELKRLEQLISKRQSTQTLIRTFEMNEILFDLVTVLAARNKKLKVQLEGAQRWVN